MKAVMYNIFYVILKLLLTIARNIGYIFGRYKLSYYIKTYAIGATFIYLFSKCSMGAKMPKDMLIMLIINAILYPFTRYMYFSIKEYIFGEVNFRMSLFIYMFFKFLMFFTLFITSIFTGTIAILYILISENIKYYINRRRSLNEINEYEKYNGVIN